MSHTKKHHHHLFHAHDSRSVSEQHNKPSKSKKISHFFHPHCSNNASEKNSYKSSKREKISNCCNDTLDAFGDIDMPIGARFPLGRF